eukprot:m51a1_g8789 hypothetical protein (182) ;mRNA; r:223242-223876
MGHKSSKSKSPAAAAPAAAAARAYSIATATTATEAIGSAQSAEETTPREKTASRLEAQHRRIERAICKLLADCEGATGGRAASQDTVRSHFAELTACMSLNFLAEEDAMIRLGYESYGEHQTEHKTLREMVGDACEAYLASRDAVPEATDVQTLWEAFAEHTRHCDKALGEWIAQPDCSRV